VQAKVEVTLHDEHGAILEQGAALRANLRP